MAFDYTNLYPDTSGNGGYTKTWNYTTLDSIATVTASGYFNKVASRLGIGDNIFVAVVDAFDKTRTTLVEHGTLYVNGNSAGIVTTILDAGSSSSLIGDVTATAGVTTVAAIQGVTVTGNTGTGKVVRDTSPVISAPILGAATATSINKMAITAPAAGSTLTVADGKTGTFSNSLSLGGTDGSTIAFGAGGTVLYSGNALGTPTSGTATNLTGLPLTTGVTGVLPVANGGTNANSASGTALDNITGFASTGFLTRTGAGAYAFQSTTNGITNANLVQSGAATLKGNPTNALANASDFTIQGLVARGAPDATNDKIPLYDNAAGTIKYVTPGQIATAATAGVSSIAGNTGAFTLSNGITNSVNDLRLDIGNLPGVTTNSNAAAGKLGEFISSNVASGAAVALTSGTPADVTSISLTAGDWDVEGLVGFSSTSTTSITVVASAISGTTATIPTAPNNTAPFGGGGMNFFRMAAFVPGATSNAFQLPTGKVRVSLSGTTTIFLETVAIFTASTLAAYGHIGARRVR